MSAAAARTDVGPVVLAASAYRIPTETPESDGTLSWESTTMVLVRAEAAGCRGLGWSYAPAATVDVVTELLAPAIGAASPLQVPAAWQAMARAVRNAGRPGIASCAISAVDVALWDLAARLAWLPLCQLLRQAQAQDTVPLYSSGGFTSYSDRQLADQLAGWLAQGFQIHHRSPAAGPASLPRSSRVPRRPAIRVAESRIEPAQDRDCGEPDLSTCGARVRTFCSRHSGPG